MVLLFYFLEKTCFDSSCKLSPRKTICIKLGKIRKTFRYVVCYKVYPENLALTHCSLEG